MKKVPGVESVEASLNEGKALVRLRSGNTVRLEELVQRVRDNAFTPKEARVLVHAELLPAGDKLQLRGCQEIICASVCGALVQARRGAGFSLPGRDSSRPLRTLNSTSVGMSADAAR